MPPKRKRVAQAPARYRETSVGPPSQRARTVDGPDDGPIVPPVAPVAPPSISILQQQMQLMQAQMSSIQEVVMGMAASSQSAPLPPAEATPPALPAAAGSAAAAAAASDAEVVGEESPQFPNNLQAFSAVPLGSLVDTKIKERIWANQFIDLGLLISEAAHETTYLSSSLSFQQNQTHRIKTINSIEQWSDAFLIFIAIHTEHCPSDTQDILKYMQLIRTMSRDAPSRVFLAYDRDFRKLRCHFSLPWCLLHQELFYSVSKAAGVQGRQYPNQHRMFPQRRQLMGKLQPFPNGYCFTFCSEGRCSNPTCNFTHKCPTCNGPHGLPQCPGSRQFTQFKRPPTPFHRPGPPFKRPPFPATQAANTGPRRPARAAPPGK